MTYYPEGYGYPQMSPELPGVPGPSDQVPSFAVQWLELFKDKKGFELVLNRYGMTYDQYFYSQPNMGPLVAGAALLNQQMTFNTDSYFLCTALIAQTDLIPAGGNNFDISIDMRKAGSGACLSNNPLPLGLVASISTTQFAGTLVVQQPLRKFDRPILFAPGDTLSVDLVERGGGGTPNQQIDLVWWGFKVYRRAKAA